MSLRIGVMNKVLCYAGVESYIMLHSHKEILEIKHLRCVITSVLAGSFAFFQYFGGMFMAAWIDYSLVSYCDFAEFVC